MNENKIASSSRVIILLAAVLLIISLFVPLWSIYLDAPQYPEGLKLQIWPHQIAGDVDIINGLNHYIGMKTLHTKDFIEFKVLPFIIGGFALLFILTGTIARKRWLYIVFTAFVLFGIIAMVDFWKWEYDYGHHLDPNAAIKVPGMAYQPPLIGFRQLLNFGAYSIPGTGGWLFIAAGMLALIAVAAEAKWLRRFRKKKTMLAVAASILALSSCGPKGPDAITLHKDACDFCKMTISDAHYMGELITQKGRVYKFDDMHCMLGYLVANGHTAIKNHYIANYEKSPSFIDATKAFYIIHSSFKSPMGGYTAAFETEAAARSQATKINAAVISWEKVRENNSGQQNNHEHLH